MTIFNFEETKDQWFDFDDGGKVQIKKITFDDLKNIKQQLAQKKKTSYVLNPSTRAMERISYYDEKDENL